VSAAPTCGAEKYAPWMGCSETPPRFQVAHRTTTGEHPGGLIVAYAACFTHAMIAVAEEPGCMVEELGTESAQDERDRTEGYGPVTPGWGEQ
jgi:organic hydroperoxide reductase OsmC/OhrA